jgi:E3 ubiquitin-protein ligase TRIP12
MDEFGLTNPKDDIRNVLHAAASGSHQSLSDALEHLCMMLVMGIEEYLRAFSAERGIPELIQVGRSGSPAGEVCQNDGDCMTLLFRAIALVLEHVPNSNTACAAHAWELLGLSSFTLQSAPNLSTTMKISTAATLAEECLRVVSFVVRDDATGQLVSHGFLREVLGTLEWADARLTQQCFDITNAVCDKVNFQAPAAAATGGKKSKSKGTGSSGEMSKKNLFSELVDRLIPQFHELLSRSQVMTLSNIVRDGVLQSLGSLALRATAQQQPKVAAAVATPALFHLLIQFISAETERGAEHVAERSSQLRLQLCLTVLLHLATCAPSQARKMFLTANARKMFAQLLQVSNEGLIHLLHDPFGTARALHAAPTDGRTSANNRSSHGNSSASAVSRFPESEHNTAIMSLLCLLAVLPAIPATAFGKSRPVAFLAVRKWLWEDDVHNFSEYPPDQWVALETALAQGVFNIGVRIRGRSFDVNIQTMKQSSGRNIAKSFVPEYFTMVCPGNVDAMTFDVPIPLADFEILPEDAVALHEFYDTYMGIVAEFCPQASSLTVKSAALWTAASILHTKLSLQQQRGSAGNATSQTGLTAQLCEMIVDAISVPEDEAVPVAALGLSCMDWLLHNQCDGSSTLQLTTMCARFGIPQALQVVLHFENPDSAQVVLHAELLLSVLEASSSPTMASVQPGEVELLTKALHSFSSAIGSISSVGDAEPNGAVAVALKTFATAIASCASITSFEFVNAGVAGTLVAFLKASHPPQAPFAAKVAANQTTPVKQSPLADADRAESVKSPTPTTPPQQSQQQPDLILSRKQRCNLLRAVLQENPKALDVLVRKIVGILPFLTQLPLVESTVSAHAVTVRPLNEALTILASLSPRMAMCAHKKADAQYMDQRESLENDLASLCPNGHRLYNRIAVGWTCDMCGTRTPSSAQAASMRCDHCDFDICFQCFRNPEVGYTGALPDHEGEEGLRPGRTFHILSSVGDVERHFRSVGDLPSASNGQRVDLYYDGIGKGRSQETLLGIMYRKAFSKRLATVLEQFENSLLRVDAAGQQAAARHQEVAARVTSMTATSSSFATEPSWDTFDETGNLQHTSSSLSSPLRGLMFSTNRRATSYSPTRTPAAARRLVDQDSAMRGIGRGITIRAFGDSCVTKARTYFLHHFHSRTAEVCACAEHTRRDFQTEHIPLLRQKPSPFEQQPEVQLLLLLKEMFSTGERGGANNFASGAVQSAFPNVVSNELGALVVKSFHASALRVAILPLFFAVPRWVSFIIREAPFLLPLSLREKVTRFACYGARRALWHHIRKLNLFPLSSLNGVAEPMETPMEWHQQLCVHADQQHGHKFTVNRDRIADDALRVFRDSQELRFPITIEFEGDKGTGSGPTIQFYSLLARYALQPEIASRFWRRGGELAATAEEEHASVVVPSSEGLFPACVSVEIDEHDSDLDVLMHSASFRKGGGGDSGVQDEPQYTTVSCLTFPNQTSPPRISASCEQFYYLIGSAIGRAFCDDKIVPLAMSSMVLEWLRIGPPPVYLSVPANRPTENFNLLAAYRLGIDDVSKIDEGLAKHLAQLRKMAQQQNNSQSTGRDAGPPSFSDDDVKMDVEDLSLTFTLPGDDNFSLLRPRSTSSDPSASADADLVTADNVAHYIQRVCDCVAFESVAIPIKYLWWGFTDVVNHEGLQMLELEELGAILLGDTLHPSEPLWTKDELTDVLVPDHGYSGDSPQIRYLMSILVEDMSPLMQRQFLEFCTGCPRLPLGGIRSIGVITVVRRSNDEGNSSGGDASAGSESKEWPLPSVNTCFRYVKLPPYPTKELMKEKLLSAITHCGTTFELS